VDKLSLPPDWAKGFVAKLFGLSYRKTDFDCAAKIHVKRGGGMGY
jgi:hypothetical protein